MHIVIEKARKSARIGSLQKNYPTNPKERGCGFWAAFIGSVSNDLAMMDSQSIKDQRRIAELSEQNSELRSELAGVAKGRVENCVETVSIEENWDDARKGEVLRRIGA